MLETFKRYSDVVNNEYNLEYLQYLFQINVMHKSGFSDIIEEV